MYLLGWLIERTSPADRFPPRLFLGVKLGEAVAAEKRTLFNRGFVRVEHDAARAPLVPLHAVIDIPPATT
ncbi:MAG: hypothetical protein ACRDF1_11325 [bacterium]